MLSEKLKTEKKIYAVCEKSGDIEAGQTFAGVSTADGGIPHSDVIFKGTADPSTLIVCCGKVNESELLFRTLDGRYYFSLCDGWGEENGRLYGISRGLFFDFGHPTSPEGVASECSIARGKLSYNTYAGAAAFHVKNAILEKIEAVMRKTAC